MKKQNPKPPFRSAVRRVLTAALCVFVAAAVIAGALVFNRMKKEYDSSTKTVLSMGTVVTAKAFGANAEEVDERVVEIIDGFDKTISWRIEDSPVARINAGQKVQSKLVAELVSSCTAISARTGGEFDVTIGPVSRLWDFGGENERRPADKEIKQALKTVGFEKVSFSGTAVSAGEGQLLDFGAVGKGLACDEVKAYLEQSGIKGAVVSVGGSILAFGRRNAANDKWRVAVRHPRNENEFLGTVLLDEGFVSTSGDYEKYFELDGKRYHHILNAKTGYPAETDLISVTVRADTGFLSDVLSTACFIVGSEKGRELVESYGAGAVFVDKDLNVSVIGSIEFERAK